ncbi:hypothetical protein K435DRAFT_776096, partial [Dendrothele bispora CBS 962.96]
RDLVYSVSISLIWWNEKREQEEGMRGGNEFRRERIQEEMRGGNGRRERDDRN